MKHSNEYAIAPGKQVIIWITGAYSMYIASVTKVEPLRLKVQESGPLANLKEEDFGILVPETIAWQKAGASAQLLLDTQQKRGRPVLSGLRSLGISDQLCHEILPLPTTKEKNRLV